MNSNKTLYTIIVHVVIFSSLQDEGTESQLISMPAAGQNSFCIQSVSLQVAVTFSDTVVETVIVTTVPYFKKSTDIDSVSEMALCYGTCLLHEKVDDDEFHHRGGNGGPFLGGPFFGGGFGRRREQIHHLLHPGRRTEL